MFKVRSEPTAADSFAAIRERRKLGMAIAAIIRMIATTINNSMREKPFVFRIASPKVAGKARRPDSSTTVALYGPRGFTP